MTETTQDKLDKVKRYEKLEEYIDQKAEEKVKQKLKKRQYANTPLELGQWTCDPDSSDEYPDISKDEILGNLSDPMMMKLIQTEELTGIVMEAPEFFLGSLPYLIRNRKFILAVSNSHNALARKLLSEDTINLKKTDIQEKKKGIVPFGKSFKRQY